MLLHHASHAWAMTQETRIVFLYNLLPDQPPYQSDNGSLPADMSGHRNFGYMPMRGKNPRKWIGVERYQSAEAGLSGGGGR